MRWRLELSKLEGVNMSDSSVLTVYKQHDSWVRAVAWSPDGRYISSASKDGTVQIWEATNGRRVLVYHGHKADVFTVAWSSDGLHIASAGMDETLQVWEAFSGTHVCTRSLKSAAQSVAWSPGAQFIATAGFESVSIWRFPDLMPIATYGGHHGDSESIAWSPSGSYLASADSDGHVFVWDVVTGHNLLTYRDRPKAIYAVSWSPDELRIASAGADSIVCIRDVFGQKTVKVYRGHRAIVYCVTWSPTGMRLASASGNIFTSSFKGSNRNIVPAVHDDNTVQVWESLTGRHIYTYYGHSDVVQAVSWSPDGQYIASGSFDQTVQVWSAPPQ